jgi:amidase
MKSTKLTIEKKRRQFLQASSAVTLATLLGEHTVATAAISTSAPKLNIAETSVKALQAAMATGNTSALALTRGYLARIKAFDKNGPRINSVIELNPDALDIARSLDRERSQGKVRGPLHGIPILIKDNIVTNDKMQTTAGSLALMGAKAPRDAFIVTKLREAGAVIIGKTNLSEWANFRSTRSTSGWSRRGGLTKNPHVLDRNTSGSSAGSGAAMAAGFAALTVGTETDGSIVSPANANGIVGLKPTLGLISRDGIVPIAHSQDTAGPMTQNVADAAVLLTVLAATDSRDRATVDANRNRVDYTAHLKKDGLKGKRLGIIRSQFGGRNDLASAVIENSLAILRAEGATLIELAELPNANKYGASEYEVLLTEFKADMAAYLQEFAPNLAIKSLADIIAYNEKNRDDAMPYFAQEHMIRANAKGDLTSKEYLDALANNHKFSRAEGIDRALKDNNLDALVAPTGSPAWLTDFVRGDNSGGGFSSPAAVAGYPHITLPAGFVAGLPCGISFVGTAWSEPTLFEIAYAFEQASLTTKHRRRAPKFLKSVALPAAF